MEQQWTPEIRYSHAIFIAQTAHMHIRGGTEGVLIVWTENDLSEVFMLQYGDTALHRTARRGKVEAVKVLVDCGAAVDIRNEVQRYKFYCT